MKFYDFDMSLLVKECEDFMNYVEEKEVDNDCNSEEQLLVNAVSSVLCAFNLVKTDSETNIKLFMDLIEDAKKYVKGELELDCVDGGWYAMDYREDLEGAFPIEIEEYSNPLITVAEAERAGIDVIKCCDECGISYVG